MDAESRKWAMFTHFAALIAFIIPVIGIMVPVLVWQLKKDQFPAVDNHGKATLNFVLTAYLAWIVGVALSLVVIGIPILFGVYICGIIFPIIAGVKANNGLEWHYPVSFKFIN